MTDFWTFKALNDANAEKAKLNERSNEMLELLKKNHREEMQKVELQQSAKTDQMQTEFEIKMANEKNSFDEKILTLERVHSRLIFFGYLFQGFFLFSRI